jgi:hypothetical protein
MMKDHFGNAYFKTGVGNYFGKDLLTPLIDESHTQGMKLFAYYSVGLDNWAYQAHPEWQRRDVVVPDELSLFRFHAVNVQSGYFDYMIQQLQDIAAAPVDGWFLDVCCDQFGNSTVESWRKIYEAIKHYRPNSKVGWNGAGLWDEERNRFSDFSSDEGWRYDTDSASAKFLRRLDKPFTIESPGSYVGLSWGTWSLKPSVVLQLEGAAVSANGGALSVGLNPLPDGTIMPAEIANLGLLWKFIADRESYFVDVRSAAEIALVIAKTTDEKWLETLHGLSEAMMDYQIDFNVVTPEADFDRFSLVILPGNVRLSENEQEQVRRFVERGGKLLAMGSSFGGLEKVLGIEERSFEEFPYSTSFAALTSSDLRRNMPDYPVLIRGTAMRVKASSGRSLSKVTVPIAEYTPSASFGWGYNPPGEQTNYDMVVLNRYGKGEAIYVAGAKWCHMVEATDCKSD